MPDLKGVHDLVPLLEAKEIGDVIRHVRIVDVHDAEFARSRFRYSHLGHGCFSLT